MHALHLGVSRLLKYASFQRLPYNIHTTYQYKTVKRTVHTFSSLRTAILRQFNKFIDEISRYSDESQILLAIRNTKGHPGLNGVFTDDGLAGMFEALV